jgi:hypothetical protein
MSQNLVSVSLSNEDLAALDAALSTVEQKLAGLLELSVEQRRTLNKMGDKSEAFCRQALILLTENRQILPPGLDLAEAEQDLRSLDQLRPRFARLRRLVANADDTEMALGSDILNFALDGYARRQGDRQGRRARDDEGSDVGALHPVAAASRRSPDSSPGLDLLAQGRRDGRRSRRARSRRESPAVDRPSPAVPAP